MQSGVAFGDPAVRVTKMNLEEVFAELWTSGMWFDGVGWATGGLELGGKHEGDSSSSASASMRSDGLHITSPVLYDHATHYAIASTIT